MDSLKLLKEEGEKNFSGRRYSLYVEFNLIGYIGETNRSDVDFNHCSLFRALCQISYRTCENNLQAVLETDK